MSSPENSHTELRRRAMDLLARREHCRHELQHKLGDRFPEAPREQLDEVLDQLEQDNLLSDERFTESWVRSRMARGYGPLYIRSQLSQRQVASALVERHLDIDEEEWQAILRRVVLKKQGSEELPSPLSREGQKLQRFLLSRGFTAAQLSRLRSRQPTS